MWMKLGTSVSRDECVVVTFAAAAHNAAHFVEQDKMRAIKV